MRNRRIRRGALAFALVAGLAGCAAAIALAPAVISFAANLLNTSKTNHGEEYSTQIQGLLEAFVKLRDKERQQEQTHTRSTLSVDVAMVRLSGGAPPAAPMRDGETLRADVRDAFQLSFRPDQDCYVYVVLFDPTGAVQPLRGARGDGLARGGTLYDLPGGGQAFGLDRNHGVETIYVVAARQRNSQIEQMLARFATPGATARSAPTDFVSDPAVLPNDYGIDGRKRLQSKVTTRSGEQEVSAERFFAEAGADLLITRWFRHG